MPFITIEMKEGRTLEQKRRLTAEVTRLVSEICEVPEDRVWVFIEDLKSDSFGKGGKLVIDEN
ncbi:2-hydroxymuconate tautomerase [Effusibacillus lacus]|uniref:Tautomerase n=1 Tax=Effusibacillus lacus TaxID=1348429 RepID=A0A292YNP5_9BACL|nr:2-hydroxymuconate tautomerase [Effusibacillus lacus]TCS74894.1 4-oxalocrotonate tautomerase [Effusibacillus lacus]GAX91568.1 4-oxalocrotonate tautomerase [Effusibacillus lacus]